MTHYADAIKAAEKAIALDPNLDDTRSWLTQAKKKLAEGIIESEE
jgi:hypothetical protein